MRTCLPRAATTVAVSLLGTLISIAKRCMALDEYHDVCIVRSAETISFPMAWHGTLVGLGRPLADRDSIDDLSQPAFRSAALPVNPSRVRLRRKPIARSAFTDVATPIMTVTCVAE